jgi:hypothetical protein
MKNIMGVFSKITVAVLLLALLWGCPSKKGTGGVNQVKADSIKNVVDTFIQNAMNKKDTYEKELKKMTVAQLTDQLAVESNRGLETFNSLAYKEAVSRGRETAPQIAKLISSASQTSLLAILAVRKMDSVAYTGISPVLRNRILIDALENTKLYNKFGLPHIKWEEAAQAIIAEGVNIKDSLKILLRNTKPAPVWGSEDFAEYQKYQYRVCDYAWALLLSIEKKSFTISPNPRERDKLIAEYR